MNPIEVMKQARDALLVLADKSNEYAVRPGLINDLTDAIEAAQGQAVMELFGYYEKDFGFNLPGFFSNQEELVAKGILIPLYKEKGE